MTAMNARHLAETPALPAGVIICRERADRIACNTGARRNQNGSAFSLPDYLFRIHFTAGEQIDSASKSSAVFHPAPEWTS
jgi:hypothetical protein